MGHGEEQSDETRLCALVIASPRNARNNLREELPISIIKTPLD
jgi:hypothetical protein